jgi:hypothetical protein
VLSIYWVDGSVELPTGHSLDPSSIYSNLCVCDAVMTFRLCIGLMAPLRRTPYRSLDARRADYLINKNYSLDWFEQSFNAAINKGKTRDSLCLFFI